MMDEWMIFGVFFATDTDHNGGIGKNVLRLTQNAIWMT
jgi:hypothetical protein